MALTYKIEQFEGPLDLLLALLAKNKVNIEDIPISLICDQYMEYINEAQRLDMELASEFILMASELMLIKSKMLLPRAEEDEEDPRAVLTDALIRYQQAKAAALKFAPLYAYYSGRLAKDNEEIPAEKGFPLGLDANLLTKALNVMVNRLKQANEVPVTMINPLIKRRVVSVEEQIDGMLRDMEMRMMYQGMKLEDYVKYTGQTMEQLRDMYKAPAEERVKTQLVVNAVMKAEEIKADENEIDAEIAKFAEQNKKSLEEFKGMLNDADKEYFAELASLQKTLAFLKNNAE
jgi:segregation and condensation protein A